MARQQADAEQAATDLEEPLTEDDKLVEGEDGDADDTGDGASDSEGGTTDEVLYAFGDEESPPSPEDDDSAFADAGTLREFRKTYKQTARDKDRLEREVAQLRQQVAAAKPAEAAVTVGPKPTFEDCGFDPEVFEQKVEKWHADKAKADQQQRQREQDTDKQQQAWQGTLTAYTKAKGAIRVKDFDEVEGQALSMLSTQQQGMILDLAESPESAAKLIYALGRNTEQLKKLASIANNVKFVAAAKVLETKLKEQPRRKTAPLPEREVQGNARTAMTTDKTLSRLEAEADKSGDRSQVIEYKRKLKERGK